MYKNLNSKYNKFYIILSKITRSKPILILRYSLYKIGLKYITYIVYELDLENEIHSVKTKIPIEFEKVTDKNLMQGSYLNIKFFSNDHPIYHNEALRLISEGDMCFVSRANGLVSGFSWISFKEKHYEPEIEKEEIFKHDEALIYRRFVIPKYRKNNISKKLTEISLRYLKERGYKKAKVYIASDNIFSIKSFTYFGFSPKKKITCIRIFNYKKMIYTDI